MVQQHSYCVTPATYNTLYPAYARVNQHDRLNPEYPNRTIPYYQDFQIFGDIEEADINNEACWCAGYNVAPPKAKTWCANIAKFYNMIDGSHLLSCQHCIGA